MTQSLLHELDEGSWCCTRCIILYLFGCFHPNFDASLCSHDQPILLLCRFFNICPGITFAQKTTTISISSLKSHTRKSWYNELHCFFPHNFEDFEVCSVERLWLWMVWLTDVASSSRKTANLRKGCESWFGNVMLFAFCYIHIWIAGVYIYIYII